MARRGDVPSVSAVVGHAALPTTTPTYIHATADAATAAAATGTDHRRLSD